MNAEQIREAAQQFNENGVIRTADTNTETIICILYEFCAQAAEANELRKEQLDATRDHTQELAESNTLLREYVDAFKKAQADAADSDKAAAHMVAVQIKGNKMLQEMQSGITPAGIIATTRGRS